MHTRRLRQVHDLAGGTATGASRPTSGASEQLLLSARSSGMGQFRFGSQEEGEVEGRASA